MIKEKIRDFNHLQEAIVAVNQRIDDVKDGTTEKIKASSGLILTRKTENGEIEILMGRLNKKNRAVPNDPAEVHDSYAIFSGNVEENDTGKALPAVFVAAAREVREESLGALDGEQVLDLLSLPTTKLIKNATWKHVFTAASFYVNISSEEGERIANTFNSRIENHPQHEIQDLAWISLNQILEAQAKKENKLSALKVTRETELGRPLSTEESNIYLEKPNKKNIKLPCGRRVAHYVARTIFYGMKNH